MKKFILKLIKEIPASYRIYGVFFALLTIGVLGISKLNLSTPVKLTTLIFYIISNLIINAILILSIKDEKENKQKAINKRLLHENYKLKSELKLLEYRLIKGLPPVNELNKSRKDKKLINLLNKKYNQRKLKQILEDLNNKN